VINNDTTQLLNKILQSVRQPARYIGGEKGSIVKREISSTTLKVALCFPDLYEIGMSNQAISILYRELNKNENIVCERVFAPAPDFREALKENNLPLFTLETGRALNEYDIIAFTMGSELAITTILGILEAGGIPIEKKNRGEGDPIVIAGGPATTNSAPFSPFFDSIFIGEFESQGNKLFSELAQIKGKAQKRADLMDFFHQFPAAWSEKSTAKRRAMRSIWNDFPQGREFKDPPLIPYFSVQDNGVIEIMRGCPNNCRFCHAGVFYNPSREKEIGEIVKEADYLIKEGGYREITLSSLSTGDYSKLLPLVDILNERYKNEAVSLSLPSLRVNSFTMDILEKLSKGKKSGLTFAIETPRADWQKSINKEVNLEKVIEILQIARSRGWRIAKFYFMVGLPASINEDEAQAIIDFVLEVKKRVKIKININVGTFIPKAHTSLQWAPQLSIEKSREKLKKVKSVLREYQIKVSYHDPFTSWIEGVISRGDKSVGEIIKFAYQNGSYLDAWDEYFQKESWENALKLVKPELMDKFINGFSVDETLPWSDISLRVSNRFLKDEYKKALSSEMSYDCDDDCKLNCGLCGKEYNLKKAEIEQDAYDKLMEESILIANKSETPQEALLYKTVLLYKKEGKASWLSHRTFSDLFEKMFVHSSLTLNYSNGYNPKPRMEFASPLPVGAEGYMEFAAVETLLPVNNEEFNSALLKELNGKTIEGIKFLSVYNIPIIPNRKKLKLMPLYNGAEFRITFPSELKAKALEYIELCHADILSENSDIIEFLLTDTTINPFKQRDEIVLSNMRLSRRAILTKNRAGELSPLKEHIENEAKKTI